MRSGRKIHPAKLLKPVTTKGRGGGKKITYQSVADIFAGFEVINRGSKDYVEDSDLYQNLLRIPIDWHPDFASDWLVEHVESGLRYEILKIDNPKMLNIELILVGRVINDN